MNKNPIKFSNIFLAAAAVLTLAAFHAAPALAAPALDTVPARLPAGSPTLQEFSAALPSAADGKPAGIYVAGTLALPIVQQPADQPGYVSSQANVVTQFRMAEDYGTTGILAHNTLAGAEFSDLQLGQYAALVFTDGRVDYYRITRIEQYQALQPNNPYSDFRAADGSQLGAADLFYHTFGDEPGQLVLQTCINAEGNPSWGRLFIIAEPVTEQVRSALSQAAGWVQYTSLGLSTPR